VARIFTEEIDGCRVELVYDPNERRQKKKEQRIALYLRIWSFTIVSLNSSPEGCKPESNPFAMGTQGFANVPCVTE
jgi:hypothetical protein